VRLAIAVVLVLGAVAHADDSWEARAQNAERVHRIENVVWALTAPCDGGDDAHQRQCRHARDSRVAQLASETLLVDADAEAFDIGGFDSAKGAIHFDVTACIRCLGVEVDGKTWFVVASGAPAHARGDIVAAGPLRSDARAFHDEAAAKAWARQVGNAHVEMIVKTPAHPKWTDAGPKAPINGIALDIVAWRVVSPCDGAVIASSLPSGPGPTDKTLCIPAPKAATVQTELTADDVRAAMEPIVAASHVCFGRLAVTGTAKLRIRVLPDGTIGRYEQQGDFVNTPMGACIDRATAKLSFAPSKSGIAIDYPITAQP
jgi:hypothetical protein